MVRNSGPTLQLAICSILLLIIAGCGKPVTPLHSLAELKAETPILGAHFDPKATGAICGRLVWTGELPHEHSFRDAKVGIGAAMEQIEKKNPGLPRVKQPDNGVASAVIFLRTVEPSRSKPWDLPPARIIMNDGSIGVEQGNGVHSCGFVHVGDEIEMNSITKSFETLRFQGASFFTLAFADADKPVRRTLPTTGVVELSSAAGNFWARSWLFVAEHPYYTLTDEDGRFTLTGVPEGDYELVCWMPNWNVERFERDPEMLNVSRVFFMPPLEKTTTANVKRDGVVYVEFQASVGDFARPSVAVAPTKVDETRRSAAKPFPSEIDSALRQLELPCPERAHLQGGFGLRQMHWDTLINLPQDMYDDCPDAMDLLAKTRESIDDRLLDMAKNDEHTATRYRCAWVLIQRRNASAIPILERMAVDSSVDARYLAWHRYARALDGAQLLVPKEVTLAIDQYGKEEDNVVRGQICDFFGAARAKQAISLLVAELTRSDSRSDSPNILDAVRALGCIGDSRAVKPIIAAASVETLNKHVYMQALGRLATAESVQYLIDHLDKAGAAEALFDTGSAKALPALQNHLAKLKQQQTPDELEIAVTHVAILRLSCADPREALLQLGENSNNDRWMRSHALDSLCGYDIAPFACRILKLYSAERDEWVRKDCIRLLENQNVKGITEAMIGHVLALDMYLDHWQCSDRLLDALNCRLQLSFRSRTDLQAFLRSKGYAPEQGG